MVSLITGFYRKLCTKSPTLVPENDDFYVNCPKLSENSMKIMDANITVSELLAALNSCSDSAPESDGLTYSVYKKLWSIVGPFILDAWTYSCDTGSLPPSHSESIIVLLPKEGKDPSDIKNWRPLTLSNCDAKITEYPAFSPQLSTCLITSSVLELLGWFW